MMLMPGSTPSLTCRQAAPVLPQVLAMTCGIACDVGLVSSDRAIQFCVLLACLGAFPRVV